ncbi:hypothetical protein ACCC96_18845 [Pseudomonas sp. Pseusp11]|uniref:hypothetical protein n=1 Tax=Pseudomonas sp. Pseusp11 TaxID=3243003 RepID=UPI0039B651B7
MQRIHATGNAVMRHPQRPRRCRWRNALLRELAILRRLRLLYPWALGAGHSISAIPRLLKELFMTPNPSSMRTARLSRCKSS